MRLPKGTGRRAKLTKCPKSEASPQSRRTSCPARGCYRFRKVLFISNLREYYGMAGRLHTFQPEIQEETGRRPGDRPPTVGADLALAAGFDGTDNESFIRQYGIFTIGAAWGTNALGVPGPFGARLHRAAAAGVPPRRSVRRSQSTLRSMVRTDKQAGASGQTVRFPCHGTGQFV